MSSRSTYCTNCGTQLKSDARFCAGCGNPLPVIPHKKRSFVIWLAGGLTLAIITVAVILSLPGAQINEVSGILELGSAQPISAQTITPAGGEIAINDPANTLDGFALIVPAGANSETINFDITATPIMSHNFGSLFNPITPLITINNGHGFAAAPMTVRIPIQLDADEFAMAFYYDRTTGKLEGIPSLAQDGQSITILTSHFSELLVSKADYAELDRLVAAGPVDSGFRPGRDDFLAPNYGSFALTAQNGHCAGQSIAALSFYTSHRLQKQSLRDNPMVDNSQFDETPDFFWDDALAYRLCSQLHDLYDQNWSRAYDYMRNIDEELTYYNFLYAVKMTGAPQYIDIRTTDGTSGHAMIVYQVTRDALWIADPNLPGDQTRKIEAARTMDLDKDRERVMLGSYLAKPDANGKIAEYSWIAYYGVNALINQQAVDSNWQTVLAGQDAAAGIFPPAQDIVVMTGKDASGFGIVTHLTNGLSLNISEAQLAEVDPVNPTTLYIASAANTAGEKLTFYRGTKYLAEFSDLSSANNRFYQLKLQPGANDIGVLYTQTDAAGDDAYIDFYRFTVILGSAKPTETTENLASAFFGKWKLTDFQIVSYTGMTDTMRDEILFNNGDPQKWVARQIGDFNSIFANSKNLDESTFYHAEIGIGDPPAGSGESWDGKYFFQTNTFVYIGDYNVMFNGVKQNYRQDTIPATLLADGSLHVLGYSGASGLDEDDSYVDMILTSIDPTTLQGIGKLTVNTFSGGLITVSLTCTMTRKSTNPGLVPEYGH